MSMPASSQSETAVTTASKVGTPVMGEIAGLERFDPLQVDTERRIDQIEMIGEEEAAGLPGTVHGEIGPGLRYLHCSRTIHQLVTDRNRAVGLYLAVASLLLTGTGALLNARPNPNLPVPIELIQRWCMPATFGTLAVLALFAGILLIRTRIGLIYEVAKMNLLLGLPIGRVKRVNPLSIFFIMHLLISIAGGLSGGLFVFLLAFDKTETVQTRATFYAILAGATILLMLVLLYIGTVLHTTADKRLGDTVK